MERNSLIDFIRGLNLISMILFHAIWDLIYIFGVKMPWFEGWIGVVWQIAIATTFVILSGYCYKFSHNKLKHGLKVFVAGIIITLVTYVFMPENIIIFGVLTMLGSCMLIFIPLEKLLDKVNSVVGSVVSLLMFIITYNIDDGYVGVGAFRLELPKELYANYITTYIGLSFEEFFSTDYFGIIPWIFLYACGYFLNGVIGNIKSGMIKNISMKAKNIRCKPVNYIGRYSLVVYMLHQPVVYGVLYVVDLIFR